MLLKDTSCISKNTNIFIDLHTSFKRAFLKLYLCQKKKEKITKVPLIFLISHKKIVTFFSYFSPPKLSFK